jgi:hypothetical protein
MLSRTSAVLMISMSVVLCTSARGSITAFWQPVTITPAAISNDPALANMQCWDLMVTASGDWNAAALAAALPDGFVFYKHPTGGFIHPDPRLFGSQPALEFTTYVSSPTEDGTNHVTIVIGGFPQSQQAHLGDLNGRFSMLWGDLVVDPPGTHQIARLTFPRDVLAQVFHPEGFSSTSQGNPGASAIIPDIPEPSMLGLFAAATLLMTRKRTVRRAAA